MSLPRQLMIIKAKSGLMGELGLGDQTDHSVQQCRASEQRERCGGENLSIFELATQDC